MSSEIFNLIGFDELKKECENLCKIRQIYARGMAKLPHWVIPLECGNGQTSCVAYMADIFRRNHLKTFSNMDEYLEYHLDGTLKNMKFVFEDIEAQAVYTNAFDGLVAMDLSAFETQGNKDNIDYFMKRMAQIADTATFIFFVPFEVTGNLGLLIRKLQMKFLDLRILPPMTYTTQEIAQMIITRLSGCGIVLENSEDMSPLLCHLAKRLEIQNGIQVKALCRELVKMADFTDFVPVIHRSTLEKSERREKDEKRKMGK